MLVQAPGPEALLTAFTPPPTHTFTHSADDILPQEVAVFFAILCCSHLALPALSICQLCVVLTAQTLYDVLEYIVYPALAPIPIPNPYNNPNNDPTITLTITLTMTLSGRSLLAWTRSATANPASISSLPVEWLYAELSNFVSAPHVHLQTLEA